MTPILELRNVRKAYGDFVAVDGVSMTVPASLTQLLFLGSWNLCLHHR